MSRTIDTALLTHIQGNATTMAFGALVQRADGTRLSLTSADVDCPLTGVPIGGSVSGAVTYLAAPGLEVSNIRSSEGFAVDNLEGTLLDGGVVTKADLLRGLWDGAAWTLFAFDRAAPSDGFTVIKTGWLGVLNPRAGKFVVEMRDLRQPFQQEHSTVAQADCRYDLGDTRCTKSLAAFTDTTAVTAVTSNQVFSISSGRADDFFGNGVLTWITGANINKSYKIKTFVAGVVTIAEQMLYPIQIGDSAQLVGGCRKRRTEDCAQKFDNVLNFGGEPDKPKIADVVSKPDATSQDILDRVFTNSDR